MDDLVTTAWLASNLDAPDLAIVDASFFMPADGRDAGGRVLHRRIFPARVSSTSGRLPTDRNPAPAHAAECRRNSARRWARLASDETTGSSSMTTARCGRRRGAGSCFAISGPIGSRSSMAVYRNGVPKDAALRAADALRKAPISTREIADDVVDKAELLGGSLLPIADARGKARFEGGEADPRPNVGAGHIPGARNLPYSALYRDDGTFKSDDALRAGICRRRGSIRPCRSCRPADRA